MRTTAGRYRFFLILLLAIAVGGGIWYCYEVKRNSQIPKDGTLVQWDEFYGKGMQEQG